MSDMHQAALLPSGATLALVRDRKREATSRLLGDTITISDQAWHEPSRLPGWTRAHVASHLARNADAFRRTMTGLLGHTSTRMYPTEAEKRHAIERGSWRSALELQIDLDTSAGELATAFDRLDDVALDEVVVLAPGRRLPVVQLPLARLDEVVLHHLDLDCGFTPDDIEPDIARWLLEWNCWQATGRDDVPAVRLVSSSGFEAVVGRADQEPALVSGSDGRLLGWLTGRCGADLVDGADRLPTTAL